jgi:hypothetical protein
MNMQAFRREAFRYTAYFCEENIWWAARDLVDAGCDPARMQVLLFTNPAQSVMLLNQRAAPPGAPIAWDYHVVLQAEIEGVVQIVDLDSRLDVPVPLADYMHNTFPRQSTLPQRYRTWVRVIPALSYLQHLYSDRSHMRGLLPASEFPDYPIIRPPEGVQAIGLDAYRDLRRCLQDGSEVLPLSAWYPGA